MTRKNAIDRGTENLETVYLGGHTKIQKCTRISVRKHIGLDGFG